MSLSPDSGVLEDVGERLPFEAPFWNGKHSAIDVEEQDDDEAQYPFPFHPLDLEEAALKQLFGYILEGKREPDMIEPDDIKLVGLSRSKKSKWKFW